MRITRVESTDLFQGSVSRPLQIIRVTVEGTEPADAGVAATLRIAGASVETPVPFGITGPEAGESRTWEVGVAASGQAGVSRPVTVILQTADNRTEHQATITVAEPGWTMWMVSHFHYDPVWWSTQGQFTEARLVLPDEEGELPDVRTAFELVRVHLEKARRDPDYKFVLAEIDYLKPYFDTFPHERAELKALIGDGRVELVGGTYNEPNTNLTSAELTIRNAVYGMGFQRGVLGAEPASAWMLDSFGHDPGFPGLMAAAGLTSSSWARGPFHQWGPEDNERMQFPAEFEWLSPDGSGLLTAYMANHYGAGWTLHTAGDLAAAERAAHEQFATLAPVAATKNIMLPVGSDHVIPARWVTDVHRSWNARYVWPRFVTAIPRDFFDAVRAEASGGSGGSGVWITPQTRDMNPLYTGKDVSYIDTKQANAAAEIAVCEAERFATLAWLRGAPYPAEPLDKAWRQLAYGAHHDAITGTEADQSYLDLLAGWREAWQHGDSARRDATGFLAASGAGEPGSTGSVTVFNGLARARDGIATATVRLEEPGTRWLAVHDGAAEVPFLAEHVRRHDDGSLQEVTLTFRARGVPGLGHRRYGLRPVAGPPAGSAAWSDAEGTTIGNEVLTVTADPARGGALVEITDKRTGRNALRGPGNELVLQEEYDKHPRWGEGPWHLTPKGPGTGSASAPASSVRAQRSPAGSRLLASFRLGDLDVTQETILWDGADHVEFRTHLSGSLGQDKLLRVRFPADVPGGLPVYQTATAVIGRPFGTPEADTAAHWWTLDNPAFQWFGLGAAATVTLASVTADGGPDGAGSLRRALGVAELITPNIPDDNSSLIRDVLISLAAAGVTATCSRASGPRYGAVDVDSNLPDFRICLGGPDDNAFTAEVLAAAEPAAAEQLAKLVADAGAARLWVPATRSRSSAFGPGADLRGPRDLPVLIVAGADEKSLAGAIASLRADLADGVIGADLAEGHPGDETFGGGAVALFNQGTPSGVVTPDGTLWMSLMRASSSWPSGVWIDGDQRTVPDGSSFAWQHWSHTFSYALAVTDGDWRDARFSARAEEYNHALVTVTSPATPSPAPAPSVPAAPVPAAPVPAPSVSASAPNVTLTALKPRGNPLASGRPGTPAGDRVVTVRLRETDGRPAVTELRIAGGIEEAWLTDLLEDTALSPIEVRDGAAVVELRPFATVTLAAKVAAPDGETAGDVAGYRAAEPAQPVYSRYWLHGKGAAPAGNVPVAVHFTPSRVTLGTEPGGRLRLTVACGPEPASGEARLVVPDGLSAEVDGAPAATRTTLRYDLPANGFTAWDVAVTAAPSAADGRYFVIGSIADRSGNTLEDAALVTIGEAGGPDRDLPPEELFFRMVNDTSALAAESGLEIVDDELSLAPGERGQLRVRVDSHLASVLHGEAQLISPFGTWETTAPWSQSVTVAPGGETTLVFDVAVPPGATPGWESWLLVKLMYFGRVRYSPAVRLKVS
ncbi:MAG TPA: glycoside hydrolase family 38 C-terminal domain-containing protein [Trebonia sp.]|jgi:alpha-mannosidase|nr:glycoside hydrolase family 38 C-terminal domain-containing protein [Trebonia sp.]